MTKEYAATKTATASTPSPLSIRRNLLRWYRKNARILPWRKTADPYRIWVSEIMLQQTRVETVLPYYEKFLAKYPTVQALAEAPQDDVLKTWENLGYYSRAKHIHKASHTIVERFGGRLPEKEEELLTLPGVGAYTAGAIASIAFGRPVPAVDGNARRVLARLFAVEAPLARPTNLRVLEKIAKDLVPKSAPGAFNQALMDLANSFCSSRKPACNQCPLKKNCRACIEGIQESIPAKPGRRKTPEKHAVAAFIDDRKGRLLIVRRPGRGLLSSLWKLPGGFLHEWESREEGLIRTVREEIGIEIDRFRFIGEIRHAYTHFRMILHIFGCRITRGEPRPVLCEALTWADAKDRSALAFSKADRMAMEISGMPSRNS